MHLVEEEVLRLLDAELASMVSPASRDHLAGCAECRSRVRDAEAEEAWIAERFRLLDHPPVKPHLDQVLARGRHGTARRVAAGLILVAGLGGVAYAAPGSALPRLLSRVVHLIAPGERPANPARAPTPAPRQGSDAGIAVNPGERFVVQLVPAGLAGTAVVTLSDVPEISVRARGGTTTFSSEVDRLLVRHSGDSVAIAIEVPSAAPLVELRLGGKTLWRRKGARTASDVPADPQGRYRFLLTHPIP